MTLPQIDMHQPWEQPLIRDLRFCKDKCGWSSDPPLRRFIIHPECPRHGERGKGA